MYAHDIDVLSAPTLHSTEQGVPMSRLITVLSMAVPLLISACGGSGSGGASEPPTSSSGTQKNTPFKVEDLPLLAELAVQPSIAPFGIAVIENKFTSSAGGSRAFQNIQAGVEQTVPALCDTGSGSVTLLEMDGNMLAFSTGDKHSQTFDNCSFAGQNFEHFHHGTFSDEIISGIGAVLTGFVYSASAQPGIVNPTSYVVEHVGNMIHRHVFIEPDGTRYTDETNDRSKFTLTAHFEGNQLKQTIRMTEGDIHVDFDGDAFVASNLVFDGTETVSSLNFGVRTFNGNFTYNVDLVYETLGVKFHVETLKPIQQVTTLSNTDFKATVVAGLVRATGPNNSFFVVKIINESQKQVEADFDGDGVIDHTEIIDGPIIN